MFHRSPNANNWLLGLIEPARHFFDCFQQNQALDTLHLFWGPNGSQSKVQMWKQTVSPGTQELSEGVWTSTDAQQSPTVHI